MVDSNNQHPALPPANMIEALVAAGRQPKEAIEMLKRATELGQDGPRSALDHATRETDAGPCR